MQKLYEAAVNLCIPLAQNEKGCIYLNEFITNSKAPYRETLMNVISSKSKFLSQHPSGYFFFLDLISNCLVVAHYLYIDLLSWLISTVLFIQELCSSAHPRTPQSHLQRVHMSGAERSLCTTLFAKRWQSRCGEVFKLVRDGTCGKCSSQV